MCAIRHLLRPPSTPSLVLGETTFRGQFRRFGLLETDRLRHLWLLGKTGTGKSTLLANLVAQDVKAQRGLALLDPHGSLIDQVLEYIPAGRQNVILFDPTDTEFPVSFNVLRSPGTTRALLVAELLSVFRKQWASSWGPRLEHVLRNALLAVTFDEQATLVTLYRFLTSEAARERLMPRVQDPLVRAFWTEEFPGYRGTLQAEALAPVLNKLGAFVANPIIRNIVGQVGNRLDLRSAMDEGRVLLAKLAVGEIGEDAAHLLGGLLISSLSLAATRRPVGSRLFTLMIDEFQHFVTDSLATVLSESRKYGLGLVLSHQYLGQLPPPLLDAIRGNIGSILAFRVGYADAEVLAEEFFPVFTAADLTDLANHHTAVRLVARGAALRPFSARTLAPAPGPGRAADLHVLREISRRRHTRPRASVEAHISKSMPPSSV